MVDANVLIRAIAGPRAASDIASHDLATSLFAEMRRGDRELVVNDAVLAEVVFILHSRNHVAMDREEVAGSLRALLRHPGFRIDGKAAALAALERWAVTPSLSFVDALVIDRARDARVPIATFDAALARQSRSGVWAPSPE